jgi:hypothetical protein
LIEVNNDEVHQDAEQAIRIIVIVEVILRLQTVCMNEMKLTPSDQRYRQHIDIQRDIAKEALAEN